MDLAHLLEIVKAIGVPGAIVLAAGIWVARYLVPSMQEEAKQLRAECREDAKQARAEFLAAIDKRDALLEKIENKRDEDAKRTDMRLDAIERRLEGLK